jgi:hypothetical protein
MKTKGRNPYGWRYPVMYMKTDELVELSRDVIEKKCHFRQIRGPALFQSRSGHEAKKGAPPGKHVSNDRKKLFEMPNPL